MTGEIKAAPVRQRSPIWMRALLIASLAINVAVIGVIAGYKMKDGEEGRAPSRQVSWIVRMVPENRKDFALAHFGALTQQLSISRMAQVGDLDRIVSAVRADPFVAAELREALETRRGSTAQRRVIVHEGLVSMLEQFERDERIVFANNLEARLVKLRARFGAGGALSTSAAQ